MKMLYSFIGLLLVTGTSQAQQGHPLDGIWLGDWGTSATNRTQVLVELVWRDTALSGNINPGFPDQAIVDQGVLDSRNGWKVRIEATGTNENGTSFKTILDGQLNEDDLGYSNRTMTGTWTQAGMTGDFTLRRE